MSDRETKRPISPGAEEILGLYFPVLDHGFVSLVDYMGTDECIERAARVSYGYGTRRKSLTRGLVRYLRRHKHTTPSEMVEVKFHCCMPMFVARQWIRHRTACLGGNSRLYFDLPGAEKRGRRQRYNVTVNDFYRRWTEGTSHPMGKKKPTHVAAVDPNRDYTISELARVVRRREETLRNLVRDGSLRARRKKPRSPTLPSVLVKGSAWHEFASRTYVARVRMKDRMKAMRLRCLNESTGEIGHTSVEDIWQTGEKPVFRVTLENGYALEMSKDHRCLTERGWMTLETATGLKLTRAGGVSWRSDAPAFAVNGVECYRDRAWLAARRGEGLGVSQIAERAGCSYPSIRKYLKRFGLQFTPSERARLSGAQRGRKRAARRRGRVTGKHLAAIRRARSGPASNFWKGGVSSERESIGRWTTEQAARVHERCGYRCVVCNASGRLHAHHVDPVWNNRAKSLDFDNFTSLCVSCYERIHTCSAELDFREAYQAGDDLSRFQELSAVAARPRKKRRPIVRRLVRTFSRVARIEHVGIKMTYDLEVAGPWHNFVADGFVVHNSVNEYSGRYSLMPMLFHMPTAEQLQTQSTQNNQGRSGASVPAEKYAEAVARWNRIREASREAYEWMTTEEIARELARIDLPLSTYTQWYWKIDLHNLLHFLTLRVDAHAQWEIQEYGRVMAGMLKRVAPLSYEAWIDYDVCGARFSRMELEALARLVTADDDRLAAEPGSLDAAVLQQIGLSKRELRELVAKVKPRATPDFELDLSRARPGSDFAERFANAVPKVDRPPAESG